MNIASIAMSLLTPAIVGRIASALGISPTIAQAAITAIIPAILGGMASKATTPSGLGVLTGLLGQQNPSALAGLGDMIGGANQASLVTGGTTALNTLLGSSTAGALAGAVAKFTGAPAAASSSLLGILAPVALGTLAQQQKASGLDAAGVANLLAGQKDNIAAALPKGFGDLLKGIGLFDAGSTPAPAMAAKPVAPMAPIAPMARPAPHPMEHAAAARPEPASGLGRWLPIIAAAALGVAAYSFWQSTRSPQLPPVAKIVYNNVDLTAKAGTLYEGLKTSIAGIKDATSAEASLPKLREHVAALGDIRELQDKLPADGRKGLAALFAGFAPALEGLVLTAGKAPGAETIVKPLLEQVMERVKALAKG